MSHSVERPTDIMIPATSLWAKLPMIAGGVGAAGTLFTIAMMATGDHKDRAAYAYLFAFMLVLSIALGSLAFVFIQHLVRAGWSTVVRRVAESSAATLPLFAVLFLPILVLGFHDLYPWSHESDKILEAKRWWLGAEGGNGSMSKFLVRAVLFLGIWSVLGTLFYRFSTQQDKTVGDKSARDAITHKLWKLSAGAVFLYGLSQSFAAVDWQMSLLPHWYSTMYGVYYFAGSMVAFYSFLAVTLMFLQKAGVLKTAVTTEHYHDIGKFMFGHTVFWAYVTFSQFMLIWYANIPEETEYFMMRTHGGWEKITYAMPVIHFFLPFLFLLSRHVKRHRTALMVGAFWLLAVHAVDIYWNVLPNYLPGGHHDAAGKEIPAPHHPEFALALVDVTAVIGIAGLFLAAFAYFLKKNAVVCIGDPRLDESLAHENF
jgi:hypothetical protein